MSKSFTRGHVATILARFQTLALIKNVCFELGKRRAYKFANNDVYVILQEVQVHYTYFHSGIDRTFHINFCPV